MLNSKSINDNITLSYIPMGKMKTTSVGIYLHRPLNDSDAAKNALLPMVLRRGSADYPSMEAIALRLDDLYGSSLSAGVSKKGEDHIISFEAECISDKYVPGREPLLSELVKLVCSIIFNPRIENGGFAADIFEQEQKNLIDRIRSSINDKRVYAHERLCALLCEGTPYAVERLGTEQGAKDTDRVGLYNYYKEIITSSKIDIYVTGDADISEVENAVLRCIDGMGFTGAEIPQTEILHLQGDAVKEVKERMDVTQGKLAMGFTTGIKPSDDNYWGLVVANSIFGGGAHGKLFNNVREKLSLAYYAGSQLHKFKGFIAVNAGVEFKNFQKAYDEVLLQLDELKKGVVSEQEFTAAKMFLINNLNSYYDDQLYMQSFYLGEKVAGTNYDIDYYIKKISAVTVSEAVAAAADITLRCAYFLTGEECEA